MKQDLRVIHAATALFGVILVEVLTSAMSKNYLCSLLSLFVLALPVCGVVGARRRSRLLVSIFWRCNAFCGVCYLLGLVVVVGLFLPTVQCVCDPDCMSSARGDGWSSGGAAGLRTPSDAASGGGDAWGALRNEELEVLDDNLAHWCSSVNMVGLYCSVFLSALAAVIHFAACYCGKSLADSTVMVNPAVRPGPFLGSLVSRAAQAPAGAAWSKPAAFPNALPAGNPFGGLSGSRQSFRMVGFGNAASNAAASSSTLSTLSGAAAATQAGVSGVFSQLLGQFGQPRSPTLPQTVSPRVATSLHPAVQTVDPFEDLDDHATLAAPHQAVLAPVLPCDGSLYTHATPTHRA